MSLNIATAFLGWRKRRNVSASWLISETVDWSLCDSSVFSKTSQTLQAS